MPRLLQEALRLVRTGEEGNAWPEDEGREVVLRRPINVIEAEPL